jgi:STAS domain
MDERRPPEGEDPSTSQLVVVVAVPGHPPVVVGHLRDRSADLATVDALARLQLHARRIGWEVRLRRLTPELRSILDLVGLADVVGATPSALEPGGQAEGGERLGIEEVVPLGDAAPRDLEDLEGPRLVDPGTHHPVAPERGGPAGRGGDEP